MCGIVGILNKFKDKPVDRHLLEEMTNVITHRGPDDWGIYFNGNIGLGHRRLSILDLEAGHQPMVDPQTNRSIVYNGEVYNYRDIKKSLEKNGRKFETMCDTEVLLKGVDTDNITMLESFNGMFAFALWDEKTKSLLLGRDRLGIKPLYYMDLGDQIIFSSEIKSLLLHPNLQREVNVDKVFEYIAYRTLAGNDTIYKNIYQIPPGHVARLNAPDYKLTTERYWKEGDDKGIFDYTNSNGDCMEQFSEIFSDAVNSRLISDVPVGTFNSGGVDSSLVSSIVRSHRTGDLHTFSAGFEEERYDERPYARLVADKLGTIHHTIVMNEYQYCDELEEALYYLEEPVNHAHTVQILNLSRLAKQYVTVVLTGEGADELFAGYPRYNLPKLAYMVPPSVRTTIGQMIRPVAESLKLRRTVKLAEAFSLSNDQFITDNARYVPLSSFNRLATGDIQYPQRSEIFQRSRNKGFDPLSTHLYFDQRTYLSSLLTRLDKMSMGASLEARVPFLDYRLVEWSYKIPASIKLKYLTNKWLVKKYAERWLPKSIVYRKKVGFGTPVAKWLRNPNSLGRYLELLTEQRCKERGYFDHKVINQFINEHLKQKQDHSEILWGLMNLELWHRNFIDEVKSPVGSR